MKFLHPDLRHQMHSLTEGLPRAASQGTALLAQAGTVARQRPGAVAALAGLAIGLPLLLRGLHRLSRQAEAHRRRNETVSQAEIMRERWEDEGGAIRAAPGSTDGQTGAMRRSEG